MKRTGTIIIQANPGLEPGEEGSPINLIELEQYLNDKVASDVFRKFNVLIRVHL